VPPHQSINGDTDATVTGLQLLAHIFSDDDLGARFMAFSGLDADDLRARAEDSQLLAALVDFVAGNEADLVASADAIGVPPATIIAAGRALGGNVEHWA
jgi:adenine/guanine phosphoribosyltransferase-like PRPP-binding protein